MSYHQYGLYLIPPPHLLHPIGLAHQLMKTEFNSRIAGAFMVHCTVKGFFKLADGATPADFTPALDDLFERTPAFQTALTGLRDINRGEGKSSILLGMDLTRAFHDLHNAVWEVVQPYIAPDCLFSPVEPAGPNFLPHITVAQWDAPSDPGLHAQLAGLCQYIYDTSLKGAFRASDLQLIEFYSEDWAGNWWETLRFKHLKGWQLA
jgi:hypothetical protein